MTPSSTTLIGPATSNYDQKKQLFAEVVLSKACRDHQKWPILGREGDRVGCFVSGKTARVNIFRIKGLIRMVF